VMYAGSVPGHSRHTIQRLQNCVVHRLSFSFKEPTTGVVLIRQNTSSVQPPPNMAAANFVVITNREGCALNGTAVASVDQPTACYVLSFRELRLVVDCR